MGLSPVLVWTRTRVLEGNTLRELAGFCEHVNDDLVFLEELGFWISWKAMNLLVRTLYSEVIFMWEIYILHLL
jgi:hypothetical protein